MSESSRPRASGHAPLISVHEAAATLPDGRSLFADLSFGVSHERIGIIGPNGSGKTTLLRILAGEIEPSQGRVRARGRVGYLAQEPAAAIGSVAQVLGVEEILSAVQRVFDGCATPRDFETAEGMWSLPGRVARVLADVGMPDLQLRQDAGTLSGGERTRLALAGLLLSEPDVLLLDEPTNHLDAAGRAAITNVVQSWRGGVVVASHDRALLDRVDRIMELAAPAARIFGGNWTAFCEARRLEDQAAATELAQARAALRRAERDTREVRERKERQDARGKRSRSDANQSRLQLNYQRENAQASVGRIGAQVSRTLGAAQERVRAAASRVTMRAPTELELPGTALHASALVIEATDVEWTPPGAQQPVLRATSLTIVGPERVTVSGANGCGKTTLLRLLAGAIQPTAGTLHRRLAPQQVAYLDQHAALLPDEGTIVGFFEAVHGDADAAATRHALARVGFRGDSSSRHVSTLSGGERVRVALACLLLAPIPPKLLLLDEPTNHLDLEGMRAVEEALAAFDGALVAVSHDLAFLTAIAIGRELTL